MDRVLARLRAAGCEPRQTSLGKWKARCPAHDDRNPSLSIGAGGNDRALIHCHSGCHIDRVLSALGLGKSDLFPGSKPRRPVPRRPGRQGPAPTPAAAVHAEAEAMGAISLGPTWDYTGADGELAFSVARFDLPDGSKTFRPFTPIDGGGASRQAGGRRPLYRLPDLAGDGPVVVVEGEKCAEAARTLSVVTTTSPFGANSARRADWTPLAGRRVLIVPDNDGAGHGYAKGVAEILAALRPGPTVTTVLIPGLAEGGDIADWIADGAARGLSSAEIRAEFDAMASDAAERQGTDGRPCPRLVVSSLGPGGEDQVLPAGKLELCVLWLRERLARGPVRSAVIAAEAEARGFKRTTLQAAKRLAGIESSREPLKPTWSWCLPNLLIPPKLQTVPEGKRIGEEFRMVTYSYGPTS